MVQGLIKRLHNKAYRFPYILYLFEKYMYKRYQRLTPDAYFTNVKGIRYSINTLADDLRKYGAISIPDFFDAAYVDQVYQEVLAQEASIKTGAIEPASKYPGDGIFQKERVTWADNMAKEGITRIYHIDRKVPLVKSFSENPLFFTLGQLYYGQDITNLVTISQHNVPAKEGCRDYHIDSQVNQLKIFVYLTDVTDDNGPHEYVVGSHDINVKNMTLISNCVRQSNTSVSADYVDNSGYEPKQFVGKKGTVLIVDTRGIHQGVSLKSGERMVLVNYFYLKEDQK